MSKRLHFTLLFLLCSLAVSVAQGPIYKYGIFNADGKQILPFMYDAVQVSDDGQSLVLKKGNELIQLNNDGKTMNVSNLKDSVVNQSRFIEITPPSSKYDLALRYSNGYVKVRNTKSKKGGILNPKGKEIIKCKYDWFYLDILDNGLIKGREGNIYHLLTNKGKEIGEFDDIGSSFNNNRLLVVKDDLYGYINPLGELVLPIVYRRARGFANNLAFVVQDDSARYIDPNGNTIIQLPKPIYDGQYFQNEVVIVKDKNSNYSLINSQQEILFTLALSHLDNFQNGIAAAKKSYKGDTWGVVNKQGVAIVPFEYHETKVYNLAGTNLIAIRKAQKQEKTIEEDPDKKPALTAKAYCYTAVLQQPKINALGATQLHIQALFIELYAPYQMTREMVQEKCKAIALETYPKATISQEFFTEVKNCDEIRVKLVNQISPEETKVIERHLE